MKLQAKKILLATFAAAMMVATASTAHAADTGQAALPPEYLAKVQWLIARPADNMDLGRMERSIWLKGGDYTLDLPSPTVLSCNGQYYGGLPEGQYSWRGQLDPKDGYYIESVVLEGPVSWRMACNWRTLDRSGDYSWGSRLQYVGQ